MTAEEARRLVAISEKNLSVKEDGIYQNVMNTIKKAIEDAPVYKISWSDNLPVRIINKLRGEGYSITSSSHRNETMYEISWAKQYPNYNDR